MPHPRTFHHRWIRRQFLQPNASEFKVGHRHSMQKKLTISRSEIATLDHKSADAGTESTLRSRSGHVFMWQSCAHFLMTRWKPLSLYHSAFPDLPMPFSPVQSAPVRTRIRNTKDAKGRG